MTKEEVEAYSHVSADDYQRHGELATKLTIGTITEAENTELLLLRRLFDCKSDLDSALAKLASAAVDEAEIREIFLANGFTIKPGHDDLKPYVYAAARALLARARSGKE